MGIPQELLLALTWDDTQGELVLLDQRLLPEKIVYMRYITLDGVIGAIRSMVVRGAPAIGVAAAYAMVLASRNQPGEPGAFFTNLRAQAAHLASARPTAVNLTWAVDRMMGRAESCRGRPIREIQETLLEEAKKIHAEDEAICLGIGHTLLPLLREGMGILTHCNAGQLAATRYGTALAPIYLAQEKGINLRLYADETRPRLQGSTLTAFELHAAGADVTVICDNMAATVMSQGKVDLCIVGCDRVAANGDVANKIGTLNVAILAKHYGIPFYVAAPTPTIDVNCPSGASIPIEERDEDEVSTRLGARTVPMGVKIYNPAFDITPCSLIDGIATERGMIRPPFDMGIRGLLG